MLKICVYQKDSVILQRKTAKDIYLSWISRLVKRKMADIIIPKRWEYI